MENTTTALDIVNKADLMDALEIINKHDSPMYYFMTSERITFIEYATTLIDIEAETGATFSPFVWSRIHTLEATLYASLGATDAFEFVKEIFNAYICVLNITKALANDPDLTTLTANLDEAANSLANRMDGAASMLKQIQL
jgi:hypothetical protein